MRKTIVPLLLLLCCPPMAILMWYTNVHLDGSLLQLLRLFQLGGVFPVVTTIWKPIFFGSTTAWTILGIFAAIQLFFMKMIPGKTIEGPVTPQGNIPLYKENGLPSFILSLVFFYCATEIFHLFPATIIYDNFGPLLGALNLFSLLFCFFLYIKGCISPSSTDNGSASNFIFDYFWGMELYPRLWGWDIKMFTNCRFGMMSWSLIILSFAAKQKELYGLSDGMVVSVLLQLLYIGKFFLWEGGYLRSMDIMHDRAGYYLCWGCLVWVPAIYTSPSLYLVNHPIHLGMAAPVLFIVGASAILVNYFADRQRQKVRATNGNCLIWGKKTQLITANYTTYQGDTQQNLLLASGWWGIARHFHYIPELIGALCWTLPALFHHILPYFYFIFLTALLLDRVFRQERRCQNKYGEAWSAYCQKVPYKVIPYFF
ncbi:MAG: 7-dehydrocholesterol reductase [Candidatus Protochlamydia sp.]|nr:7-dehydrocholesterol reductase [Candidatus Protochlamydia sp.]